MERAFGKYVAVANQGAFIADIRLESRELAEAAHPNDRGIVTRYIRPKGIRIDAVVSRCSADPPRAGEGAGLARPGGASAGLFGPRRPLDRFPRPSPAFLPAHPLLHATEPVLQPEPRREDLHHHAPVLRRRRSGAVGGRVPRPVGPAYAFLGLGLSLYFAAQGRGRVVKPLFATLTRFVVAGGLGAVVLGVYGWGLESLFAMMALGLAAYELVMVWLMRRELGLTGEI